jgi:UDP-N-acetylglucosamine 2-epimerase (non-hydrolysing)
MKKILFCYGTRPELIKLNPIIESLSKHEFDLFFTGQHDSRIGVASFPSDFPPVIYKPSLSRLDSVISSILETFPRQHYDLAVVQGDTASALGCALAAFNGRIRVAHVEAGLRSHDTKNPFPEEVYRRLISQLACLHFSPTALSKNNLENENVTGKIYVVGNTALDNLRGITPSKSNEVIITMHRRENLNIAKEWFVEFERLARLFNNTEFRFILFKHPALNFADLYGLFDKVELKEPEAHEHFVKRLAAARLVITDSGGIQEEASFLSKKVIVTRKTTERPEGLETGHLFLCREPGELFTVFKEVDSTNDPSSTCPYGDGFSGARIATILRENV